MRFASALASHLSRGTSILLPAIFAFAIPLAAGAAPFSPDAHTTLLLHFDGDALSAHAEQATASSGLVFGAGKVGNAAYFGSGANLRHERAGNLDGTRGTIEFWLKPGWSGGDGQNHTIMETGSYGGMLVFKDGGGYLRIILNRFGPGGSSELGVGTNVSSWSAGVWHHVAFTWSPSLLRVYTDGVLRNSSSLLVAPPVLTTTELQFGAQGSGATLDGWLDDLRIGDWDRTPSQITADANGTALANEARTLLLMRFDADGNGTPGQQPLISSGLAYESGVFGQGARLGSATDLRCIRQGHLLGERGTVEFWLQPGWNGNDNTGRTVLAIGSWGGLVLQKDGGNYWRIILNRYGPGGTPELGAGWYAGAWTSGSWHHCAFTWSPDQIEVFVDGVRVANTTPGIAPPALADLDFRIGSDGGATPLEALVDELRISDTVRSASEIQSAFVSGLQVSFLAATPDTARLWVTWPLHAVVLAQTQLGDVIVPPEYVAWSTSDANVVGITPVGPRATGGGTATVTATVNGATANVAAIVRAPVLAPTHEALPEDLTTPAEQAIWDVPVLVLRFFTTADGESIDTSLSPDFWDLGPSSLADMDARILGIARRTKFALEQGSRFRAYSNPNARPSLGYHVVDQITVYEQTPPGKIVGDDSGHPVYEPDWFEIFERFNVRHYIEDLGVKEVWVWTGGLGLFPCFDPAIHRYEDFRGGWESNMSSPLTGDISNSNRDNSDLPVYDRTYIVYGYNLRRSQAECVHDHGHQLESQFAHVNWLQDGNTDLFWKKWRGQDAGGSNVLGRCGDTHSPPNTLDAYDYENPAVVMSDIADWTPDHSGADSPVSVSTWGDLSFPWPDGESDFSQRVETQWYMYWMMSMPGFGNGLHDGSEYITNWWEFVGNWDGVVAGGRGLHTDIPPLAVGDPDSPAQQPLVFSRVAPNPAVSRAGIELRLGRAATLRVGVYDLQGRCVRTLWSGPMGAGERRMTWDLRGDAGERVSPGVYLLRAAVPGSVQTRKLCVVR